MRVFIHRHQNKADGLIYALQSQGHIASNELPLDLCLLDHDGPDYYRKMIAELGNYRLKPLLYTHGATSYVAWDGLWEPHPNTQGYLAISQAEKEVMEFYDYPNPVEVIGWYWSPISPPRPMGEGRRVLFAPIHPLGNGFIPDPAKEANTRTFMRLLKAGVELTVHYVGDLQAQGLWSTDKAHYIRSQGVNQSNIFEQYDCVVSYGTFAYLSVAAGVPTYMYAQDIPPWDGHNETDLRFASRYHEYEHLLRYPYDLDDTQNENLFRFSDPAALQTWTARHIGQPLDPANFCQVLERYAH